jgi:alpha-beta hydrolase superfamily lysophospholipase
VPALRRFTARDGVQLAYRLYTIRKDANKGSVVLIHGSSARSNNMHPLAKGFAQAGFMTYALDVRGHGESGAKGQIAYIGQLEDDLEDFLNVVKPSGRRTLVGFSSGAGFALRFAGDTRQSMFDNYLLLSPFLHQDAATNRPSGGRWTAIGLPRIIGLKLLNRVGITWFNGLPIMAFALNAEARKLLTPWYSYALAANFRPHDDYRRDILSSNQPAEVLAGQNDELFFAERFASVFSNLRKPVPVTIVPGTGHMALTLSPTAIQSAVSAVGRLRSKKDQT